jgi:hypothetical protein
VHQECPYSTKELLQHAVESFIYDHILYLTTMVDTLLTDACHSFGRLFRILGLLPSRARCGCQRL